MTQSDTAKAKHLIKRLRDLSSDESGAQAYRNLADKLLQDVSGLEHVATLILSHKNPGMAALRIIQHPRSEGLAKMLLNDDEFAVLNQLVSAAYMAKMITLKSKRNQTNSDVKTYRYLAKLYKKGTAALRDKHGYDVSGKKAAKRQFSALRDYIDNHNNGFDDGFFDEDDIYEDSGLDLDDDPFATDEDEEDDLFDGDGRIPVNELIDELRAHGYTVTAPPNISGLPANYRPNQMPEVNFDFTGKATLELISDRLLTITEGMQMILNRIYGREVKLIDHPQPNPALSQLANMSTAELIRLYNALGKSLGRSSVDLADFDPDEDEEDDQFASSIPSTIPSGDLDEQLERLRNGGEVNVGVHLEASTISKGEEEPADIAPPVLTDNTATDPPPPTDDAVSREPSAAEMFNNAAKTT